MSKEVELKKAALVTAMVSDVEKKIGQMIETGPQLSTSVDLLIKARYEKQLQLLNDLPLDSLKNLEQWHRGWMKLVKMVGGDAD